MLETLKNAWKLPDLRKRICYTLMIIVIFRFGAALPVPFLDASVMQGFGDGNLLGFLNMLTGGAFQNATLFALSISPYITSSIVVQLLAVAIPALEQLSKEGAEGRKRLNRITRYVTIALALVQSFAYYQVLNRQNAVMDGGNTFGNVLIVITIISMFTAGSMICVWLGEQIDEKGILEGVAAQGEAYGRFIDVLPTLTEHKGEYLYYRTDHHWTTLGAYYAYQQFCETLGLTPFDRDAHTAETCEDFYGTHYSKARTWNAEPDTITWYDLQNSLTVWNVTGPGQPTEGTTTGLYDLDKLKVYDKYAMFLHGNNGLSRVEGSGTGKILVIKDSYANSFVSYLTANYAAIDVVDFRNYNYGLDQLIAANDYDQILVLYSYASFTTDPYLYRAGVAG